MPNLYPKLPTIELSVPPFQYRKDSDTLPRVGLAVESMRRHMSDEGWQIFAGLEDAGYTLYGKGLKNLKTSLDLILDEVNPSTVVMQDKREWDVIKKDFRDPYARFDNVHLLKEREDIFKLTILKDSHQRPDYHKQSAHEIGCHAWIVYYLPSRVKSYAKYVRQEHLIRTYHTVDGDIVPPYSPHNRRGCLLSGALSKTVYPLRVKLSRHIHLLPQTDAVQHPGYHRAGCATPNFLRLLSNYKIAVCTASIYGYALRKMIEATAAGCVVLTDLPEDDCLPEIDGNLIRIPSNSSVTFVADTIARLIDEYNPERQEYYAKAALARYEYRTECNRLANEIEGLRQRYPTCR